MVFATERTLESLVTDVRLQLMLSDNFFWTEWTTTSPYLVVPFEEFVRRFPDEIKEKDSTLVTLRDRKDYLEWMEKVGKFLYEAISNANRHGNKDDPTKKINVTRYYGSRGVVYSISDEGQGFEIKSTVEEAIRINKIPPHGFNLLQESDMTVSFNSKGNEIYLQYLLKNPKTL